MNLINIRTNILGPLPSKGSFIVTHMPLLFDEPPHIREIRDTIICREIEAQLSDHGMERLRCAGAVVNFGVDYSYHSTEIGPVHWHHALRISLKRGWDDVIAPGSPLWEGEIDATNAPSENLEPLLYGMIARLLWEFKNPTNPIQPT